MGWDMLGCTTQILVIRIFFSWQNFPKLNDSLLGFHWHVGRQSIWRTLSFSTRTRTRVLGFVDQRILQRRNSFGHNLNKNRKPRREAGANPSIITAKGQLPGPAFRRKLLHNLSRAERGVERRYREQRPLRRFFRSAKNTRKNTITRWQSSIHWHFWCCLWTNSPIE